MSERADTWGNRQLVAKYGKPLRYPLCRAALGVWQTRDLMLQTLAPMRQVVEAAELNRNKAALLVRRLQNAGKPEETKEAALILSRSSDVLREARSLWQHNKKGIQALSELLGWVEARFAHESIAALQARDFAAFKALALAWKAWKSPGKSVDQRTLVMLEAIREEALDEAQDKGGALARCLENAAGAHRMLPSGPWPKLTARDLHQYLVNAKAFVRDKNHLEGQLRQVRRLANKTGIRLQQGKRVGRPKGSLNWRFKK